ncbi:sulfite exporter TauE/SafE family protein [Tunicatimonas pelagia]|uniref:sulfite exporter TauE/SafE family protein n=1 Tax=Tunicatimonas pelagia TaxID=931531 RepID=UPI0026655CD4|nr:sulfite exporter TauE/SafE family protein [Tunicatimonas pelagia]WKN44615.1 sulfite exporter TauE/SafE family protein [Tunicatimonas pelagia]
MDFTSLSLLEWGLVILCAMLVGMSKTGVMGAGLMVIPVLASIFGGRSSTGFLLPMLSVADILAVRYYNRHAQWSYLVRLFPWTMAGIALGVWFGDVISDEQFKASIGVIIFICLGLLLARDFRQESLNVPNYWWISALTGTLGGFATMIGNAAAPIMAIYLLSMRLPKNDYIGTAAWFFLIINLLKIPLHVFIWHTITLDTVKVNAMMVPAIALGAILGFRVVRILPERAYRIFLIISTAVSAFFLF